MGPSEGPDPGPSPGRDTLKASPVGVPDHMAVLETARPCCARCPGSIPRRGAEMKHVLGVLRIARDPAKVEDQVRLLARTLKDLALEPDGKAAACKAVPSGFDSHQSLFAIR